MMRVNKWNLEVACVGVLLLAGTAGWAGSVTVYPKIDLPAFDYNAPEFKVTADGQSVPVRHYNPFASEEVSRVYYYAHFGVSAGATAPTRIEIDVGEPITNAEIHPRAYGIKGVVSGSKLSFPLDRSRYLAVSINGRKDLLLMADPNETDRPASSGVDAASGKPVFNIAAAPFKADATGVQPVTETLRDAIKQAGDGSKGGIVYVPAGRYFTSKVSLPSQVWLYLEPGAVLIADTDRTQWRNDTNPDAMIFCRGSQDAKVYGRGVIYCNGKAINDRLGELKKSDPETYGKYRSVRLRAFEISGAQRLTVDGVLINESTAWTVYIQKGSDIVLSNVKVLNSKLNHGTNDGINIGGGSRITVRHCFASALDDAICLKGIYGTVDTVLFEDVVSDSARSNIKFGMQGLTSVMNVTLRDFHGIRGAKGLDISHDLGQADYRNLVVEDASFARSGEPMRLAVRDNAKNWGGGGRGVASVVGVKFSRIDFDAPEGTGKFSLAGYDAENVFRDVAFQDVRIGGKVVTAADFAPKGRIHLGPFVTNLVVQGKSVALPPWPPKKEVKNPPPSKSRAGRAWEEAQAGTAK